MSPVSSLFFGGLTGSLPAKLQSSCGHHRNLLRLHFFHHSPGGKLMIFHPKKLVGGWFRPNWKSSLKIPKIFETTTSCNYLWMCFWTFSHNLCVVWFFCASPTLLLLYWWLQSFVSTIQPEILNGTRTSGTSKIHNFHSDIAKYTKGSNAMFKSYLYLIFSWFIYKYINTWTINYAGNIRILHQIHMGVSQNRGVSPKMDGEHHGKEPY